MARFRYSNRLFLFPIMIGLPFMGCQCGPVYTGTAVLTDHPWLKNKRIFLDPGHGSADRRTRSGPNDISEPAVNLGVALVLADMLKKAGADVELSRSGDRSLPDTARAEKARAYRPDLLISIHHAGSIRKEDCVNYPVVLIWGSSRVQPASRDFAGHLLEEMNKISEEKGAIRSDFTLYPEEGTTILKETRYLCPAVIGEAGFYTDVKHSIRLKDRNYVEKEAESYFFAISRYFKWGNPSAIVEFSCHIDTTGALVNLIRDKKPRVTIMTRSDNELPGVDAATMRVTLDGVPVKAKEISPGRFAIDYGKELYPGFHRLRFSFQNLRHQSSMILTAPFTVEIRAGDRDRLAAEGRKLLGSRRSAAEGLKMLLASLSTGPIDAGSDAIVRDISRGFAMTGDAASASYFAAKLSLFYDSDARDESRKKLSAAIDTRLPIEYLGKQVRIREDACCGDAKSDVMKN
jgi:N-acetylmuramoyl-L-alanine amidase